MFKRLLLASWVFFVGTQFAFSQTKEELVQTFQSKVQSLIPLSTLSLDVRDRLFIHLNNYLEKRLSFVTLAQLRQSLQILENVAFFDSKQTNPLEMGSVEPPDFMVGISFKIAEGLKEHPQGLLTFVHELEHVFQEISLSTAESYEYKGEVKMNFWLKNLNEKYHWDYHARFELPAFEAEYDLFSSFVKDSTVMTYIEALPKLSIEDNQKLMSASRDNSFGFGFEKISNNILSKFYSNITIGDARMLKNNISKKEYLTFRIKDYKTRFQYLFKFINVMLKWKRNACSMLLN